MKVFGIIVLALLLIETVRLVVLYRQVASYKQYWQQQAALPVPEGAIRYVALGDSAAQGIGANNPEKGYVGLIRKALQEKYNRPIHVTNLSVTGAKVQDVIDKQLPQLQKLRPTAETIVTIEIGANNYKTFEADQFTSEMEELMAKLPPQTVISDLPYFGGGRARSGEKTIVEANKIIKRLAVKYELRLAPLHKVTKERDNLLVYAADFFHPNNRGYQNWFSAFWQALGAGKEY